MNNVTHDLSVWAGAGDTHRLTKQEYKISYTLRRGGARPTSHSRRAATPAAVRALVSNTGSVASGPEEAAGGEEVKEPGDMESALTTESERRSLPPVAARAVANACSCSRRRTLSTGVAPPPSGSAASEIRSLHAVGTGKSGWMW